MRRSRTSSRRLDPPAGEAGPSFLRVGSWIGGDRDGNPFVTADVLRETMRLQSARALRHYLDELHELGGELSLSGSLMRVSGELGELAERSTDHSANRRDEPYRRAIGGIYSRLAETARELDQVVASRQPLAEAPPYATAAELAADLDIVAARSKRTAAPSSRAGACARCGARSTCSAFIWRRSTCVRIPTCTSARSPNCSRPRSGVEYLKLMSEASASLLLQELRSPRPLVSPFLAYSEETQGELGVFRTAAGIRKTYGAGAILTSIISKAQGVSDMLELALLLKEVGLVGADGRSALNLVPLFETIDDLRACVGVMDRAARHSRISPACRQPGRRAGSDARLFRQQQGRRLRHLGLGALQVGDRPGRGVQEPRRAHPAVSRPRRIGGARRRPEL